jgi:hypothetical protein
MQRTDMTMSSLRSVLSHKLPQTHSRRNIPTAKAAANALHPIMPIPRDSTYSGNTGPVIEVDHAIFQRKSVR